jgi:hypothetical protein
MEANIKVWMPNPRIVHDGHSYAAYLDKLGLMGYGTNKDEALIDLIKKVESSLGNWVKANMIFKTGVELDPYSETSILV